MSRCKDLAEPIIGIIVTMFKMVFSIFCVVVQVYVWALLWYDIQSLLEENVFKPWLKWMHLREQTLSYFPPLIILVLVSVRERAGYGRLFAPLPSFCFFFSLHYNRKVFVPSNLMPGHINRCQAAPISVPTQPPKWLSRNEYFFYSRFNILNGCFQLQPAFSLPLSFWGFAVRMNYSL